MPRNRPETRERNTPANRTGRAAKAAPTPRIKVRGKLRGRLADPKTSAILLAAGEGSRMGASTPKGWLRIRHTPLVLHAIGLFGGIPLIHEIIVVAHPEFLQKLSARLSGSPPRVPVRIVAGGKTRQASVWNGIQAVAPQSTYILTHDVARPLIRKEIVEAAVELAHKEGASVVAARAADTLATTRGRFLDRTLDRNRIAILQTPQVFRADILRRAHERASRDRFTATDETSLVRRIGQRIAVVWNPYPNLKVTVPSDRRMIEALMQ